MEEQKKLNVAKEEETKIGYQMNFGLKIVQTRAQMVHRGCFESNAICRMMSLYGKSTAINTPVLSPTQMVHKGCFESDAVCRMLSLYRKCKCANTPVLCLIFRYKFGKSKFYFSPKKMDRVSKMENYPSILRSVF
ncbi:hypothetical protein L1887_05719 [Cichorium endivia]|nr:hypothetical protein L1887_05719 [Cichorium endivia]